MAHRAIALIRLLPKLAAVGLLFLCTPAWNQTTPVASPQPSSAPQAQKTPAAALGVFVYPRNNQPAAIQQKDENECYGWARQQTGIDPAAPPPDSASTQKAKVPPGGAVKGAAAGAAGGTAIGAITGDTGEGAAVGATVGAVRGRRAQKKAEKQAEQQAKSQAQAAQKSRMDTFRNAFSACMDARQYSVK